MKLAPLTLLFVCAAPARADVAVPQAKTWRDGCAARLDAAAKRLGLQSVARASVIPLVRDDGARNPVQYVQLGANDFTVTAGEEAEARPDLVWSRTQHRNGRTSDMTGVQLPPTATWFRRLHNRFGKIEGAISNGAEREFKAALDDCLKMGESK